jgi:hypothetical protein
MRWYSKIILGGLLSGAFATSALAQDICASTNREATDLARAEQLRIQAAEQAARQNWEIKMFPVKNFSGGGGQGSNYSALCIFRIEVVLQPRLNLVQVRAPKELMSAIGEAIKTVDVPPPPPAPVAPPYVAKSVEITAYVLVSSDTADPSWMPIPAEVQSAANQLKTLLPNNMLYLADTVVVRGTEGGDIGLEGATDFQAKVQMTRSYTPSSITLQNLRVVSNGGTFNTTIDIPLGTQVVVGKASVNSRKVVVLVLTAKFLK